MTRSDRWNPWFQFTFLTSESARRVARVSRARMTHATVCQYSRWTTPRCQQHTHSHSSQPRGVGDKRDAANKRRELTGTHKRVKRTNGRKSGHRANSIPWASGPNREPSEKREPRPENFEKKEKCAPPPVRTTAATDCEDATNERSKGGRKCLHWVCL
jgi:hypothetical protein